MHNPQYTISNEIKCIKIYFLVGYCDLVIVIWFFAHSITKNVRICYNSLLMPSQTAIEMGIVGYRPECASKVAVPGAATDIDCPWRITIIYPTEQEADDVLNTHLRVSHSRQRPQDLIGYVVPVDALEQGAMVR